ncbi:RagB/SusD family nutrient uptake outer membrane protein [Chryseobacterium sp. DT-3]|uniref:RagB/SusD family nutrient uptake outer membrane protein n=1 Tax=Chryseobacterium sp. DT-3 TaxID=3396164 RepID=UPI003F1D19F1
MKNIIIYAICTFILIGCKKQDEWLEKKSNKSDIIPSTIEDFQALLDNTDVMSTKYPAIGLIGADNSYVLDQTAITSGTLQERNAYKWAKDIYEGELFAPDWTYPYQVIEYSNVVLEGLEKIKDKNNKRISEIRGAALFFRAFAYYQLAQLYSKQYNINTANTDLGLPLKLNSDVNDLPNRSTLQETYDRIINDLLEAESLLPLQVNFKTRPTKLAAEGMLSKVYFNMQNYTKAKEFADIVLSKNSELIDFNTLSTTMNFPFPTVRDVNPEIIFYAGTINYSLNSRQNMAVSKDLIESYEHNDLRKQVFYKSNSNGTINFGGRYTGAGALFSGIATNEILLIRSESLARSGNLGEAMKDLNKLLKERWKKENGLTTYTNKTVSNAIEALALIILERRKELPFTGNIRWEDLRRLNLDGNYAKTVTRNVGGQNYSLEPNSSKYVFPIPPVEINLNPLTQNIR